MTILLISCKNDSQINNPQTYKYHYGDKFTLKINDIAIISPLNTPNSSDSTIEICFKKIINYGRCYKSQCYLCYGSLASIQISMINQGDTAKLTLNIIGCDYTETSCDEHYYYRKDTLGYRVCLIKLDPYTDYNNTPINPNDYIAKFQIAKL